MQEALTGAAVVVHAAASVDGQGERAAIFRINVEGTGTVLAAAQKQNLKQLIQNNVMDLKATLNFLKTCTRLKSIVYLSSIYANIGTRNRVEKTTTEIQKKSIRNLFLFSRLSIH